MSQLFKSVLARSFLVQRALQIQKCAQINHFNKLSFSNSSILPVISLTTPKRSYVTQTPPSQFGETQNKLDRNNDDVYDDMGPDVKMGKGYGYNKNFSGGNGSRFGNQREDTRRSQFTKNDSDYEGKEQVGLEDAEPMESDHEVANYASKSVLNGFDQYDLPAELLERMKALGYDKPFEIQEATLKQTLAGKDLVGKAFTGSGKTLAFAIPIITKILRSENRNSRNPKCLILSPTRELCCQLQACIQELAPFLKCLAIYGGTDYNSQVMPLRGKVDIVCATPGRLRDLMNRGTFITTDIETVCLDEADELLKPTFIEQIQDVIEMSNQKQMLMFSATINRNVVELIKKYMENPAFVDLTKGEKYKLPTNIEHALVRSQSRNPTSLISHYLKEYKADKCIVFTKTKRQADFINDQLRNSGHQSSDLHSDHSQSKRSRILDSFRTGRLNVLVATDVAARGLDIPAINLVIQVGFPANGIEYYIHRSGRCGRAGRVGTAILIDDGEQKIDSELFRLVKFTRLQVPESIANEVGQSMNNNSREGGYNSAQRGYNSSQSYGSRDSYQSSGSYNSSPRSYNRSDSSSYNRGNSSGGYRQQRGDQQDRFSRYSREDDDAY